MEKKQFAVFGLGRFGMALARTLSELDVEVLVVDKDKDKVSEGASFATYAVQADASNEEALRSLGIENFDVACVCTSEIQASIMITLLCKEQGIKNVITKSQSPIHTKLLEKVGADKVVFPEEDSGIQIAHKLVMTDILGFIDLSEEYGIAEFEAIPEWIGKNLLELNFRQTYGLNMIAIKDKQGKINVSPLAEDIIESGDTVLLVGSEEQLSQFDDRRKKENKKRHTKRHKAKRK